ncbi:hypothetical protein ON010_g3738 [Phytophthora cinnamomi]|nr:hypothetical protein ON010_g3738 [Phytophthora cinnamomi]
MSAPQYAYLRPSDLATSGYCYGVTQDGTTGADTVHVDLVLSGRWHSESPHSADVAVQTWGRRAVTEAEAQSGIGTYMGRCVCVPRVPLDGPKRWDCGVVVGYPWNEDSSSGRLHLVFIDGPESLSFEETFLQDLAVETYAMRPCAPPCFHGEGRQRRATRQLSTIFGRLNIQPPEETTRVPLFDVSRGVGPGTTETPQQTTQVHAADERLLDSDDDSDTPPIGPAPRLVRAKRTRSPSQPAERSPLRRRARFDPGNSTPLEELDTAMGIPAISSTTDVQPTVHGNDTATQHFRPSSVAVGIHDRLVSTWTFG